MATEQNADMLMNEIVCQALCKYQPPNAPNWDKFDSILIKASRRFQNDVSMKDNPFDDAFCQLHLMNRVAIQNRHYGQYKMAMAIYQRMREKAHSKKLTPANAPRFFITLASNMSVLYRNWADNLSRPEDQQRVKQLRKKSINQTKLMQRYMQKSELSKTNRKGKVNALLKAAYLWHYSDSKWNSKIFVARMHCEEANNLHRLFKDLKKPNTRFLRKAQYHYSQAYAIHIKEDFGIDSYFFFDAYVNWIYDVRSDMLSNKRLMHQLLQRVLDIARTEFGELSMEVATAYKGFSIYYAQYLHKYARAIKFHQRGLAVLQQCIDKKFTDSVKLNERHPLWFRLYEQYVQYHSAIAELYQVAGNWASALSFYQQTVSNAIVALKLDHLHQEDLKNQVVEYKQDAEHQIESINGYSDYDREKCECVDCKKKRKKYFSKISNQRVKEKEESLKSSHNAKKDKSLKNFAGGKQCAHCGTKMNVLLRCSRCRNVYYCSKKHQKLDWKRRHKYDCCSNDYQ